MYFNAYFKEMKIGAQREAQQSWSSCVQLALGQAALQWPHAKLWAACPRAACPHTLPLAAPPHQAVSPCSAGLWTGGRGVRRRRESWHCPWATPLPGWLLVPGEGGRCCFGWDAGLCSDGSSQMQRCQQCSDTGPQDPPRIAPAADRVGDGMGLSQPLPFANPKADAHPSAVKRGTSRAPLRCSAQSCWWLPSISPTQLISTASPGCGRAVVLPAPFLLSSGHR